MHVFLFSGIVVSLVLTEMTGFSPGGIIVAGYLSMFVMQPKWIMGTLCAALLTYWLIQCLQSHMLLYGRRLFAIYVLTGILVAQVASWLLMIRSMSELGILIIGYLIPGLIARDFSRQGVILTTAWLGIAVLITRLIVLAGEGWLW